MELLLIYPESGEQRLQLLLLLLLLQRVTRPIEICRTSKLKLPNNARLLTCNPRHFLSYF